MKTETKDTTGHTKTPWIFAYGSIYQGDDADTVEENTGRLACMDRDNPRTTPTERDANARFIVTAANHHAELIHMLKHARGVIHAVRTGNVPADLIPHIDSERLIDSLLSRLNAK